MKTLSALVASAALFGAVAFVPIYGGVLVAFVLFALFLLAIVGVIGGQEDRTVRQHDAVTDPKGWRRGSGPPS
jgi:hypothetical protein